MVVGSFFCSNIRILIARIMSDVKQHYMKDPSVVASIAVTKRQRISMSFSRDKTHPWMDRKCKDIAFLSASREWGFLHICNSDMYSGTVVKADDKILLQLKLCIYCMFKNYSLLLNCVVCLCQLNCSTI